MADDLLAFPADGSKGAHRFLLGLAPASPDTHAEYQRLCTNEFANGQDSTLVAGAFQRTINVSHAAFAVDTPAVLTAVTIVTPTLFADLRVPTSRSASIAARGSLEECSEFELQELAQTVSFGGFAVVERGLPGYDGDPVCERLTCIDSQPPPRRYPNQWRIETNWPKGGWIEWGARKDAHGQALYFEHWKRLPKGEGGPHLALRRSKAEGQDALLLVVDEHFILLDDRPTGPLPTVTPGEDGHPDDRGALTVLAEQASSAEDLRQLNSYCSVYGSVSAGWRISLSSWPWLEGTPLLGAAGRLKSIEIDAVSSSATIVEEGGPRHWDVVENTFTPEGLAAMLSSVSAGRAGL